MQKWSYVLRSLLPAACFLVSFFSPAQQKFNLIPRVYIELDTTIFQYEDHSSDQDQGYLLLEDKTVTGQPFLIKVDAAVRFGIPEIGYLEELVDSLLFIMDDDGMKEIHVLGKEKIDSGQYNGSMIWYRETASGNYGAILTTYAQFENAWVTVNIESPTSIAVEGIKSLTRVYYRSLVSAITVLSMEMEQQKTAWVEEHFKFHIDSLPLHNDYYYTRDIGDSFFVACTYSWDSVPDYQQVAYRLEAYPHHHTFRAQIVQESLFEYEVYSFQHSSGQVFSGHVFKFKNGEPLIFAVRDLEGGGLKEDYGYLRMRSSEGLSISLRIKFSYFSDPQKR